MWRKATNATPCPVGKESSEDPLTAYLTSRLTTLGLDAENGLNRMFLKAAHYEPEQLKIGENLRKIKVLQFGRNFLSSHFYMHMLPNHTCFDLFFIYS